jgi:hypothetical protein
LVNRRRSAAGAVRDADHGGMIILKSGVLIGLDF